MTVCLRGKRPPSTIIRFDDGASSHPVIDDAQKTLRRSRHIISAYRLSNVLSRLHVAVRTLHVFHICSHERLRFEVGRSKSVLRRAPCSVALRAQRASVRSLHAHTVPPRTRTRSSPLRCFPPWCPAGTPASPEGAHIASRARARRDSSCALQACTPPCCRISHAA